MLRTTSPWFDDLIFNTISLDYHETLMAAAGDRVESLLTAAANLYAGKFFCVVEGAIPTANRGVYGMIGGRTMLSIAQEICPNAKAFLAIGTCAPYDVFPTAYQRDHTIEGGVAAPVTRSGPPCTTARLTGPGAGAASQAQFP